VGRERCFPPGLLAKGSESKRPSQSGGSLCVLDRIGDPPRKLIAMILRRSAAALRPEQLGDTPIDRTEIASYAAHMTTIIDAPPALADLAAWLAEQTWSDFAQSLARDYARRGTLSERQVAAAMSMRAKCAARDAARGAAAARPAAAAPSVGPGLYMLDGDVYRVAANKAKTRLYAKRLVGVRSWAYAPGVVNRLTDADLVTTERAAEFGLHHGFCCNCGIPLTDDRSLAAGYGPVCARNNGWAWGDLGDRVRAAVVTRLADADETPPSLG
jgi:hypothetical protein